MCVILSLDTSINFALGVLLHIIDVKKNPPHEVDFFSLALSGTMLDKAAFRWSSCGRASLLR